MRRKGQERGVVLWSGVEWYVAGVTWLGALVVRQSPRRPDEALAPVFPLCDHCFTLPWADGSSESTQG